ncbi:MAG: hypothetical protein K8I27_00145 [Planctomycetes bacterium]|nr:hypothetical protein [Planctomycetota bacterium]
MSDLAQFLLKQAKRALREHRSEEAEALIKRARRHDRAGPTPGKLLDRLHLELLLENLYNSNPRWR